VDGRSIFQINYFRRKSEAKSRVKGFKIRGYGSILCYSSFKYDSGSIFFRSKYVISLSGHPFPLSAQIK